MLERDVRVLAREIGERNVFLPGTLDRTADFVDEELSRTGLSTRRQTFRSQGEGCHNVEAEIRGTERPEEIIVVGAHYDTVAGSPGANDNGSGVAAVLALARRFADLRPRRTLRFVCFVNEEPPFFTTPEMGSLVYARRSAERDEDIRGMLSLETIGYYDERPGTQEYPLRPLALFYPDRGDFIAFVANLSSWPLLRRALRGFREASDMPAHGAALPAFVPGVGWSDHWAFWQAGFPALMVTDTAPYRYPHYHLPTDTPGRLDYSRMARVVEGLQGTVARLTGTG